MKEANEAVLDDMFVSLGFTGIEATSSQVREHNC